MSRRNDHSVEQDPNYDPGPGHSTSSSNFGLIVATTIIILFVGSLLIAGWMYVNKSNQPTSPPLQTGITQPATPPNEPGVTPPTQTSLHKYRKSVDKVNEVKVDQIQIWHWAWVPGEVDRQKLWLGAVSGEDVTDPSDAAWIAASALEQMNQGLSKDDEWHVGAKRTVTPQEGVKQHFEYLVVNPDGSLTTTTDESMASWISADDAALLDLDGQGYNPYIQSLISNK